MMTLEEKQRWRELWIGRRRIPRRLRVRQWTPQGQPMFRGGNIHYELSRRDRGLACGGIGWLQQPAGRLGLAPAIDESLHLLKEQRPYSESNHVLNLACNILAGGECLQDLDWLRNDEVYLEALGTHRIADPTTAGDFCRRFIAADVRTLLDTINQVRLKVLGAAAVGVLCAGDSGWRRYHRPHHRRL
ncbi:MAG: hypothetical protein HKL95_07865 [Phycisphaerae bacterium]|nr:hypothetical protein [Phycisphaerae bacterium]